MTRADYIEKVKVKLDEFSPFEEPISFIAAAGDPSYDKVKPVVEYIENELDNATQFCLRTLPLSLLSADITKTTDALTITDGVGHVSASYADKRLVRVTAADWRRAVTHFYTSEDAKYLLQQDKYTRSGTSKPAVYYVPETDELELFSFPSSSTTTSVDVQFIDLLTKPESLVAEISDYIVLKCAQVVYDILGNHDGATLMENEFNRKLNAV